MREIKFRAWDKKSRKMFNVDVLAISPCTWDCPDYGRKGVSLAYQPHIKVMQFTGLHDVNGKEIYEGDIVEITGNYKPGTYTVIWDSYRVAWWLKNIKQREKEYDDDFYQLLGGPWQCDIREIIGNIHENPELLEGRSND